MTADAMPLPDDLLRTCISCGFCLPACPTYQDTRIESSSPRGRINLMRGLQIGALQPDDLQDELGFCLGCRACETVCPAGVRYGALLEHGRDAIDIDTSATVRALLWAVSSPRRTRLLARAARTGQLLGLDRLAPTRALRTTGAAAPRIISARRRRLPERSGDGEPCALHLGCVGHALFAPVAQSAAELLRRSGHAVVVPGTQGCCGALHAHNGDLAGARALATRLVRSFEGAAGPIATTAGGCGAFMADYGHLLETDEAVAFAARVRDISTLVRLPAAVRPEAQPLRVAYQDSCHLRNGQRVTLEPRALLAGLPGVELVETPSADRCCGAAGTYALLRPADSMRLLDHKMEEIAAAGVDVIATGNPGCLLQFRLGVRRAGLTGVRVAHTIELIVERAVDPDPARSS